MEVRINLENTNNCIEVWDKVFIRSTGGDSEVTLKIDHDTFQSIIMEYLEKMDYNTIIDFIILAKGLLPND